MPFAVTCTDTPLVVYAIVLNALLCFPWVVSVLLCTGNIEELLQQPVTWISPMAAVYYHSTGSVSGSVALLILTVVVGICGTMDLVGSAGRAVFSASRDQAIPKGLAKVHQRWNVPIWALITAVIPMYVLSLIYIGSTTAFYAILSAFVMMQMVTYIVPIALLVSKGDSIELGPWQIGRFRYVVHSISLVWSVFLIVFTTFPTTLPVTAENMNYATVITGGLVVFAAIIYFVYARNRFDGPIVEVVEGLTPVDGEADSGVEKSIEMTKKS